jgi:PAS domain S-box-containing protein
VGVGTVTALATESENLPGLRLILGALGGLPEGVFVVEAPSGRLVQAHASVTRLLGGSPAAGCGACHPGGRPLRPEEWPTARTLRTGEPVWGQEVEVGAGVARRAVTVTTLPLHDDRGRMIAVAGCVTGRDDRRSARRILVAHLGLISALGSAEEGAEAVRGVLRAVAEPLGWDVAALLKPLPDGERLGVRSVWSRPGALTPERRAELAAVSCALDEGIAGRVWRDGRTAWSPLAGAELVPGMGAALAALVTASGRALAVLVLLGRGPAAPGEDEVRFVESAAASLAQRLWREAVQRELHRSNAWLRALIESAPMAIVVTDRRGTILEWSRAAEELYGWTRAEMVGHLADEAPHLPEDRREELRAIRSRILNHGAVRGITVPRRRRDGTRLDVSLSMAPVLGPGGQAEGVVGVAVDVTERIRFLEIAAHELRNPMTSVKGIVAHMRRSAAAGRSLAELADHLAVVESEVDRLSTLLNEVLEGFRVGAGELRLEQARMDLRRVVEAALRPFAAAEGRRFVLARRPPEPVLVLGDARRLEDVVRNLLANARKYSPADAEVRVEVALAAGWARVSVLDRGVGIPETERDRIFEPFYRASNVAGSGPGGLGLGLFLCRRVVDLHGGRIWAANRPGGGTALHMELPLAD